MGWEWPRRGEMVESGDNLESHQSDIMPFIGGPTQTTSSISTTLKFLEYLKTNYLLATGLI